MNTKKKKYYKAIRLQTDGEVSYHLTTSEGVLQSNRTLCGINIERAVLIKHVPGALCHKCLEEYSKVSDNETRTIGWLQK